MVLYKKRLRFPFVGYYGLIIALVVFIEVLSRLDQYNSISLFYFMISIILVSIMLLLLMINILGYEYLILTEEKIIIRRAIFKKIFILSSYSNYRIVHSGSKLNKSIVGNEKRTGKEQILIPQYRLADHVESLLEIILQIVVNQEHITDTERNFKKAT